MKKDVLNVYMVEVPPFCCFKSNYGPYGGHLCHRGKGVFVVYVLRLSVLFRKEPYFEVIYKTVGITFHFVHPSTSNCFLVRRVRDEFPCLVFA